MLVIQYPARCTMQGGQNICCETITDESMPNAPVLWDKLFFESRKNHFLCVLLRFIAFNFVNLPGTYYKISRT